MMAAAPFKFVKMVHCLAGLDGLCAGLPRQDRRVNPTTETTQPPDMQQPGAVLKQGAGVP